jgi:hypothetical protein
VLGDVWQSTVSTVSTSTVSTVSTVISDCGAYRVGSSVFVLGCQRVSGDIWQSTVSTSTASTVSTSTASTVSKSKAYSDYSEYSVGSSVLS